MRPLTGPGKARGRLRRYGARLREEWLAGLLVALLPLRLWAVPTGPADLAALVEWRTIAALAGLMVLSRGIEMSGLTDRLGRALVLRLGGVRSLAAALVLFSAGLSAVVTNDVALFVSVPLTVGLGRVARLPVGRLVIFQALAVNAGSTLSPVGNPQNLFLWQTSGAGFVEFARVMAPLSVAMMAVILLAVPLGFRPGPIALAAPAPPPAPRPKLMRLSLIAYPVFLLMVNGGHAVLGAGLVIGLFALVFRDVLRGTDWTLILVFVLMFIDLGLLARLEAIALLVPAALEGPGGVYLVGALLSQGMSNVPAAIFLAPFAEDWRALAWGVSVGGFGLALGSLANLIALRLSGRRGLWREFHLWSLPAFAICLAIGALVPLPG